MKETNKLLLGVTSFLFIGVFFGFYFANANHMSMVFGSMDMDEKRDHFITHKKAIQIELLGDGDYKCCLEKPCVYCIEKTPGHGEGATCDCMKDVVTGVHPCGECIGEIMEGHGNKYLAKYFAKAIAEKVGEDHIDTLREIMSEKYDIPVDEQL
ncbi:hypothetical protein HQ529_04155 [Candidatus Woesearchaeota archaeon]|nr:hypothetical protein [Candidatus Woesearchaeota archaeon]